MGHRRGLGICRNVPVGDQLQGYGHRTGRLHGSAVLIGEADIEGEHAVILVTLFRQRLVRLFVGSASRDQGLYLKFHGHVKCTGLRHRRNGNVVQLLLKLDVLRGLGRLGFLFGLLSRRLFLYGRFLFGNDFLCRNEFLFGNGLLNGSILFGKLCFGFRLRRRLGGFLRLRLRGLGGLFGDSLFLGLFGRLCRLLRSLFSRRFLRSGLLVRYGLRSLRKYRFLFHGSNCRFRRFLRGGVFLQRRGSRAEQAQHQDEAQKHRK